MIPVVTLAGTPVEMGHQHAQQIALLRPLVLEAMEARLAEVRHLEADAPAIVSAAHDALATHDRPLLDFLEGLAHGLALDRHELLVYTLGSYLRDLFKVTHPMPPIVQTLLDDGCTAWAASPPWSVGGAPLLAKNRDFRQDHIPLQILCDVRPLQGHRYLCLGSAGSPLVYSSGINERGLAIADTHVLSRDLGPGLPRSSLMRDVLEQCDSTQAALAYLRTVPHMGGGTLVLADARGELAVCESGHRRSGYLQSTATVSAEDGRALASANHFVTDELTAQWVEDEPPMLMGNSAARRARVLEALQEARGRVDAPWARQLMSAHGSLLDALCRHLHGDPEQPASGRIESSTISSAIYLPRGAPEGVLGATRGAAQGAPALWLINGAPCEEAWEWKYFA
jgi:hypothetical protein